ncbi:unnamed protein product [Mycena citricolor]|uniref:G-patch domain-containing protein n=1 Tax=Mycena citricolor TaxID=2018698 RepID=A0AAD2H2Z9_9AGAR|nr:unnamed protein product [Mycena citricolor]
MPRRKAGSSRRNDWTKAPAFVSGDAGQQKMEVDEEEGDGDEDEDSDDGEEPELSKPPSPRIREEEDDMDERPRMGMGMGGIGSRAPALPEDSDAPMSFNSPPKAGIGSSKAGGGIGSSRLAGSSSSAFSKGGLGSAFAKSGLSAFSKASEEPPPASAAGMGSRGGIGAHAPPPPPVVEDEIPPSFGSRKPSFVRNSSSSSKPAAPLSSSEQMHFNKISGSIGARLLSKMGWQSGAGLGASGEGIVTPVESKLRPQKMGMGYRGFKEKTDQSKAEARRRGEAVSDEESETPAMRKARKKDKEAKEKRSDVWKRPQRVKTKVEHKTYEQIIAAAGEDVGASSLGQIIDATGAELREVSSITDISLKSTWSPSNDPTRIPEVRHNIRLIAEDCKKDLDGLAREAKALDDRKQWIVREDARLRKKVEEEADLIARLQQVHIVANEIDSKSKELASSYEPSLDSFSPLFYKLSDQFGPELEKYRLDEIAVAAIAPLLRRLVTAWNPLESPGDFVSTFRTWRNVLRIKEEQAKTVENQVDVYGTKSIAPVQIEKPMTPFESLLWNVWLPKVRTAINNDWTPYTPQPAVKLYEVWASFLPAFIRDNLLDQLVLPKVKKAVAEWNAKRANGSLRSLVFPWLPHLGLRTEDLIGDAQRKLKSVLRSWNCGEDMPEDLTAWREVFDAKEWDAMLLKYVVPKLGALLREDFHVNPRDQDMAPLSKVIQWSGVIRPSIFSQILETEFIPKWLDVLHLLLVTPGVSYEEVAQWFSRWKESFPENVQAMPGISQGFTRGLQLMNKAIELGPDAPTKLARPDFVAEMAAAGVAAKTAAVPKAARPSARKYEITFRSIVEEFAASHNLLFMPTGKAHEISRVPLFRVSRTVDGKDGLLVYLLDDAVWAPSADGGGAYRAIPLEDMVARAS